MTRPVPVAPPHEQVPADPDVADCAADGPAAEGAVLEAAVLAALDPDSQPAERAVEAFRRRRRQRVLPVLLVVLAGLASAAAALSAGSTPTGGTAVLSAAVDRVAHLEAGVVLLFAAPALARGSRLAWAWSAGVCAGVLAVEAVQLQIGLPGLLAAAALAALVLRAGRFRSSVPLRSRLRRLPACLLVAFLLFAGLAAAGAATSGRSAGAGLVDHARGVLVPVGHPEDGLLGAWAGAVRLGAVLAVASLLALVRPCTRAWSGQRPADVRRHAETHGRSSTAPLIALPDSGLVPLVGGQALAGVAVRGSVAVTLGTPVAPAGLEVDALVELTDVCERRGLLPVLLGLDERQRRLAEETGFRVLRLGVEAFLDPASFSTVGKRRSNVRHSVTRAEKDGVEVLRYDETVRTPERDAQLAAISAGWVERKGGPELGLTLGRFDVERLDEQEVMVAVTGRDTPEERVVAFVTWLPYDGGRQAVLDLMRRADDCPPGTMEKLVVDSIADAGRRGRVRVSLGGVPLAAPGPREGRVERALGWVYENGRSVYDAHGLFRFKDKFAPDWEALYVAVPAEAHLPRVALAVGRAFLPAGALRSVVRTVAAREWVSVRQSVTAAQRPAASGGLGSALRRRWVAALVCAGLVGVAAVTRPVLGLLPGEVIGAYAWSTEQVLAGETWRSVTAALLTRDLPMLLAMVLTVWPVVGLVQRLAGAAAALATWGLGCVVGYLGTAVGVGLLAPVWEVAEAASRVRDYGPSGGVAAGLAVVAVLVGHRTLTWTIVGVVVVGSALHGQIADVEHLVSFAAAWLVTKALLRRAARRREAAGSPDGAAGSPAAAGAPAS